MLKYKDRVQASINSLRAVLRSEGFDGFQSELKNDKVKAKSGEIVEIITAEIENFIVSESDCEIDQVSGRIETKLASIDAEGVSISDESLEKIADSILKTLPSGDESDEAEQQSDSPAAKKPAKSILKKLFDSLKWNKEPGKKDVAGQIIYILNNINKDKKLDDFKKYIKQLSDSMKKDASDEWTPSRLEKILDQHSFFKKYMENLVLIPYYNTWMYGFREKYMLDNPIVFQLGQTLMKISEDMSDFALEMNYFTFKFTEFNIFRAQDDLTLKMSELMLRASHIGLDISEKMLHISDAIMKSASVTHLVTQATSLINSMISSVNTVISFLTSTLQTAGTFMSSVFSLAASIAGAVLSAALSVSSSILSALLSFLTGIAIYIVPFFAIVAAVILAIVMNAGIFSIQQITSGAVFALAVLTAYSAMITVSGVYAAVILSEGGILGSFLALIVIPIFVMSAAFVITLAAGYILGVSAIAVSAAAAVIAVFAAVIASIVAPIAFMLAASAASAAALLAVAAGIGLIAMILILFGFSLLSGDTDFFKMVEDFLHDTPIYQWYLNEVKGRGGFKNYIEYQFGVFLGKIKKFKDDLIQMIEDYLSETWFYKWWMNEVRPAGGLWEWIKFKATEAVDWITDPSLAWRLIKNKILETWQSIKDIGNSIVDGITEWWNSLPVSEVLNSIYNYIVKIGEKLKAAAETGVDFIKWAARGGGPDPAVVSRQQAEQSAVVAESWRKTKSRVEQFISSNKDNIAAYKQRMSAMTPQIQRLKKSALNQENLMPVLSMCMYEYNTLFEAVRKISNDKYQEQIRKISDIGILKSHLDYYKTELQKIYKPADSRRKYAESNISLLEQRINEIESAKADDDAEVAAKGEAATIKLRRDSESRGAEFDAQDRRLNGMTAPPKSPAEPEIAPYPLYDSNRVLGGTEGSIDSL